MFCPNDGTEIQEHTHTYVHAHADAHTDTDIHYQVYVCALYVPCPKCEVTWEYANGRYNVKTP